MKNQTIQACLIHNARIGDLVRASRTEDVFHSMHELSFPTPRIGILLKISPRGIAEVWHPDPGEVVVYQAGEIELVET
jgi:hypothetical protein